MGALSSLNLGSVNANTISLALLGLCAVIMLFSILIGLKRGLRAALIRLITLAGAAYGAFILRKMALDKLMTMFDVEAKLNDLLGEDLAPLAEYVLPIAQMLFLLIAFVILFVVLRIVSLIVYALLHWIGKKKRPAFRESRLFGMVIGAAQGLLLIACIVLPLSGMVGITGQLVGAVGEVMALQSEDGSNPVESLMFIAEYPATSENALQQKGNVLLDKYDDLAVKYLTKMTDKNGKEVSLNGQIEGIRATASIASTLMQMQKLDLANPEELSADDIRGIFDSLDELKNGMSEEGIAAVNNLITEVAGSFLEDVDIDLSGFDIGAIDFKTEGNIVATLMESGEETSLGDVAKLMTESTLIVQVLDAVDVSMETSPAEQQEIIAALDTVEGLDETKRASIYAIFGIGQEKAPEQQDSPEPTV